MCFISIGLQRVEAELKRIICAASACEPEIEAAIPEDATPSQDLRCQYCFVLDARWSVRFPTIAITPRATIAGDIVDRTITGCLMPAWWQHGIARDR